MAPEQDQERGDLLGVSTRTSIEIMALMHPSSHKKVGFCVPRRLWPQVRGTFLLLFVWVATMARIARAQGPSAVLAPVSREMLCITEGEISQNADNRLSVNTSKMRAYVNGETDPEAELHFAFLGPTGKDTPLGSGEMRRQFGLKLLAEDACNLLYVMWRIEPESRLVVSIKSNPGQHASAECGNRGYRNIKPHHAAPVPALQAGVPHALRAALKGEALRVFADGVLVWEGSIETEANHLHGPVGMRSDNARLEFTLLVPSLGRVSSPTLPACKKDVGD